RKVPVTVKHGDLERILDMAVRENKHAGSPEELLEEVKEQLETREKLRKKGIPVIPTYRLDEKTGDIYMTDLTLEHGKRQYILGNVSGDELVINQRIREGDFDDGVSNKEELLETLWDI